MDELEVIISAIVLFVGILTFAFRNTPNPYVGVRIGYTYLSKEAWRKANTFAGIYCTAMGITLLAFSMLLNPPRTIFLAVLLTLSSILAIQSYRIAKETYEKEDLSSPIKEAKPMETVKVKPYLLAQVVPIAIYLILATTLWDTLPDRVAIHFDLSGKPDSYADKFTGALVLPLVSMTIVPLISALASREPTIVRFPMHSGQQTIFVLLVGMQLFIVAVMSLVLLYNAGVVFSNLIVWLAMGFITFLLGWTAWIWKVYRQKQ